MVAGLVASHAHARGVQPELRERVQSIVERKETSSGAARVSEPNVGRHGASIGRVVLAKEVDRYNRGCIRHQRSQYVTIRRKRKRIEHVLIAAIRRGGAVFILRNHPIAAVARVTRHGGVDLQFRRVIASRAVQCTVRVQLAGVARVHNRIVINLALAVDAHIRGARQLDAQDFGIDAIAPVRSCGCRSGWRGLPVGNNVVGVIVVSIVGFPVVGLAVGVPVGIAVTAVGLAVVGLAVGVAVGNAVGTVGDAEGEAEGAVVSAVGSNDTNPAS